MTSLQVKSVSKFFVSNSIQKAPSKEFKVIIDLSIFAHIRISSQIAIL